VDVGRRRQHRLDGHAGEAVQVLEELPVERVGGGHHQRAVPLLERQDRVLAREGAREGAGDELDVELERIDLDVGDGDGLGQRLGDPVLVDPVGLAPGVGEPERGQQFHRRQVGPAKGTSIPPGGLAEQLGPLDVLPGRGDLPVLGSQDPLALERLRDEIEGEIAGPVASHAAVILSRLPAGSEVASRGAVSFGSTRPRGGQMAQPTGPQFADEAAAPPSAPERDAAGRDIFFSTRFPLQAGQRTSASSELRRISSSKARSQALQAYS
jgi:hypothetical protein